MGPMQRGGERGGHAPWQDVPLLHQQQQQPPPQQQLRLLDDEASHPGRDVMEGSVEEAGAMLAQVWIPPNLLIHCSPAPDGSSLDNAVKLDPYHASWTHIMLSS